jgi:hypothetical protein
MSRLVMKLIVIISGTEGSNPLPGVVVVVAGIVGSTPTLVIIILS